MFICSFPSAVCHSIHPSITVMSRLCYVYWEYVRPNPPLSPAGPLSVPGLPGKQPLKERWCLVRCTTWQWPLRTKVGAGRRHGRQEILQSVVAVQLRGREARTQQGVTRRCTVCRSGTGGATGRALDLRSVGRGFKSYSRQCCVTTLGKLFTPLRPCHQAV